MPSTRANRSTFLNSNLSRARLGFLLCGGLLILLHAPYLDATQFESSFSRLSGGRRRTLIIIMLVTDYNVLKDSKSWARDKLRVRGRKGQNLTSTNHTPDHGGNTPCYRSRYILEQRSQLPGIFGRVQEGWNCPFFSVFNPSSSY